MTIGISASPTYVSIFSPIQVFRIFQSRNSSRSMLALVEPREPKRPRWTDYCRVLPFSSPMKVNSLSAFPRDR
jgi:hypothetical protein